MLPKRSAYILCAVLIDRIYEAFPLLCPICAGQMRVIAFITYSADIRHILAHIGAQTEKPRIAPARGPPLWDESHAGAVKVWSPCRIGARVAKRHQPLRPVSASVGEGENSELTAAGRQAAPGTAHAWESRQISGNWL
jgi:hypothetical protein